MRFWSRARPWRNSRLNLTIEPVTLTCTPCGYEGPLPEGAVDPHDQSPLVECPGAAPSPRSRAAGGWRASNCGGNKTFGPGEARGRLGARLGGELRTEPGLS